MFVGLVAFVLGVLQSPDSVLAHARGGFPRPPALAMVHAWTGLPNPEGPFAHDNVALPYWVTGLELPRPSDLSSPRRARRTRALGLALAETYGARLPYARLVEAVATTARLGDSLAAHRAVLRQLVPELTAAQRARRQVRWNALTDQAIREFGKRCGTYIWRPLRIRPSAPNWSGRIARR